MTNQIILEQATVSKLCPSCKEALAAALGLTPEVVSFRITADADHTPVNTDVFTDNETEFAELGLQAARTFLENCNAKTIKALEFMVNAGDKFSLRTLERQMGVEEGELRGVWTGLTKRTRTVLSDPDGWLVEWSPEIEGDYFGKLVPVTRDSLRRALAELDE